LYVLSSFSSTFAWYQSHLFHKSRLVIRVSFYHVILITVHADGHQLDARL
jgi:hypothetical protein